MTVLAATSSQAVYDAIVIGAGPCGSTAAYYLVNGMEGYRGKRVALLDKAQFPRDKFCGDAWCSPALDLLEEMGVLQQLERDGLVQDCTSGGFVSPSGESYVSTGGREPRPGTRCYAIKRMICDERIARCAVQAGAELFENTEFKQASLDGDGLWTVRTRDGRLFRGRMLIAADGATSQVARSLGIVNTAPTGVASRQYVKGGTHNFKSGGVLFYPHYIIPGYVAIFRHYNDDIDIGCYLVPGGAARPEELGNICQHDLLNDPFMQRILGPKAEFLERPRVASLRTGGVAQSTGRQFMAVGDAAGQTDPLTGEGIHTGMIGAKLAARRIHEMTVSNDFSAQACAVYHQRWIKAFGKDFPASATAAKLTYRYPLLLDAANIVAQRKGDAFMANFGAAMTGSKPKGQFLRPGMAISLGLEVIRQILKYGPNRSTADIRQAYAANAVRNPERETAFARSCIRDSGIQAGGAINQLRQDDPEVDMFLHASDKPDAKQLLVIHASEYGFAHELALSACRYLAGHSAPGSADVVLSPLCLNASDFSLIDWQQTSCCLFVCSTAGDGVAPQSAKAFFAFLAEQKPDLHAMQHATLALGDSAYPHFCRAGETLDELLMACGSTAIEPLTRLNKEDMSVFDQWIAVSQSTLGKETFWPAEKARQDDSLRQRAGDYFLQRKGMKPRPSAKQPFMARVIERKLLTDIDAGGRETWQLSVDARQDHGHCFSSLQWQSGDALGVMAHNAPQEVDAILAITQLPGDAIVQLPRAGLALPLQRALSEVLDIKIVNEKLVDLLLDAQAGGHADNAEQERLRELKNTGDPASHISHHELQDMLREYPHSARQLGAQQLVDCLNPIKARFYSIACSPLHDADRIDLCVASVRYHTNRARSGLASTYLADRAGISSDLAVFVQRNPHFRLPAPDSSHACVMIGAGTGIAPYRAFLQELAQRDRPISGRAHLLFFGCRHQQADFLYADEWQSWKASGGLQVFCAFSRDQQQKIYVQHRLLEQAEQVWQRMEDGDCFYICGDATRMAVDVEQALLMIIREQGQLTEPQASAYLQELMDADRLQKDVWAG